MATTKLVIRKRLNQDGTYPLGVRITKDRKSSYIFFGETIEPKFWDDKNKQVRKSHPNSGRLNNLIYKKFSEIKDKLLEVETAQGNVSAKGVKNRIRPEGKTTFFSQAKLYLANLKTKGKFNQHSADAPRVERFREFLKGGDITFQEITIPLLKKFAVQLKSNRDISDRTVVNHLVVIRTIFNQAIQAQIADQRDYPFGKGKIKIKFPQSIKIGLTIAEVKKLEDANFPPLSPMDHARNAWLISFYFAGARVSDVLRLRWSDFQDNRLHYAMGKNAKTGSLKVPEKAVTYLEKYLHNKKNENDLVLPELKKLSDFQDTFEVQREIALAVSKFDKTLKKIAVLLKIAKPMSMHIARHTFGNLSGDKIPVQMLQKLYRHSSITTTIGYQSNFIHKDADEALDAVITF